MQSTLRAYRQKVPDPSFPRRVLYVNHTGRVSGAELSLLGLVAKLDRGRFTPMVACPREARLTGSPLTGSPESGRDLAARLRTLGVPHLPLRIRRVERTRSLAASVRDLIDVATASLALARLIVTHRIDLVHANSSAAHLVAGAAGVLTGVPVVWHVRDLVELGPLGKLLFATADAVACVSESVERHVARFGGDRDRVRTVPNGIDLAALRASARRGTVRRDLAIPDDVLVLTQVAQITPWKGHRFLLGALPHLRQQFPKLRVLLAGEPMTPKDADYLRRLRAEVDGAGLADVVTFTGWRDDIASVIVDSDVVVLPSEAEPFGRVVLEALALGKPVVATNAGGVPELVRHQESGLLVDFGDTRALVDALATLLGSPALRRRMGENASAGAERFDLARTVAQVHDLYDGLLQSRRSPGPRSPRDAGRNA